METTVVFTIEHDDDEEQFAPLVDFFEPLATASIRRKDPRAVKA